MTIEEQISGNEITLTLTGRLETSTSPGLEKKLAPLWEKGDTDITLDVINLDYLSSAGLRVLLQCEKRCTENSRTLTIMAGDNEAIREIFDMTGFMNILNIV